MARHVAEGGNQYDDFGKHVLGLSEELNKLRKFKTYMARSGVMAEGLLGYMDVVNERIDIVKDNVMKLQRKSYYTETFANFEKTDLQEVPEDVAGDWIDQLTIRQFNEELKDVFPYIYKLVSEASKPEVVGPDELTDESGLQRYTGIKKYGKKGFEALQKAGREGASEEEKGAIKDKYLKKKGESVEEELDAMFDDTMGQFAEKHGDMDGPMDVKIGPDGALSKMDSEPKAEKPKLPMTEFILTMFDRETGKFPKGETAVLTAVEKDYGEDKIESAKDFIERIMQKYEEVMIPMDAVQEVDVDTDEGNAYAHAVRKAKMNGAKKGDKIDHPDGDEEDITIEKDDSDYQAKKKALQDIQTDKHTAKDPELQKELMKRKAELEKTKEAMDAIRTLAGIS
jgi:hypothetical protein